MSWTPEGCIPIIYRPENIEEMEIQLELLKRLEDRQETFLMLFQPAIAARWDWFSYGLFKKILKLVKREAIKERAKVERTLQYAKEQQHSQDPTILYHRGIVDEALSAKGYQPPPQLGQP